MKSWVKYFYIFIGVIFLIASITFLIWFYKDFIYLLSNPSLPYLWARLGAFLSSLVLGIIYLFYGIKSYKINKLSNTSLEVLIGSLVVSFIFIMISSSGGLHPSPTMVKIGSYARPLSIVSLIGGILTTIILSIISIFKTKI